MNKITIWDSRSVRDGKSLFYFFQCAHLKNADNKVVCLYTGNNSISIENTTSLNLGLSRMYIDTELHSLDVPVSPDVYSHYEMIYGLNFVKALKMAEEMCS